MTIMKLYLSSYRIPDIKAFSSFVGKDPSLIKIGLILNAHDYRSKEQRNLKREDVLNYFTQLNFNVQEIDLHDHKNGDGLLEKFREFDVVWLNGGNTYSLRWAVEQSNCEPILKQVLSEGVIYAGDSAGAIIVGPTLKYYDLADDPHVVPETIYEGLNIVDFAVLPHWGSEQFSPILEDLESKLNHDGYNTIRLNDYEYLLVEDGKIITA